MAADLISPDFDELRHRLRLSEFRFYTCFGLLFTLENPKKSFPELLSLESELYIGATLLQCIINTATG